MARVIRIAAVIAAVVILWLVGRSSDQSGSSSSSSGSSSSSSRQAESEFVAPPAVGETVNDTYFRYVYKDAKYPCHKALEDHTVYGFRGTGWLGFEHAKYVNKRQRADGHLIFAGDDAEIQDKFGTWVRVNYICEWDPAEKRVVRVSIDLGMLPRTSGK